MRFGKIAISLLLAAVLTASATLLLKPGWGSPIAALGERLGKLSFLGAFVFGTVGIICDRRKFFAISTVIIIVSVVLYIFVCSRLAAKYGGMLQ